jgi:type I restriction enzyme S subunit
VTLARVLTSTVDKHTIEGEIPVRLCNYTDVYYNDTICDGPAYMTATATPDQIASYAVEAGDVVFTKDSETADDIAIAAYVETTLPGVVYGYHLSTYRPRDRRYGKFLKWLLDSKYAKATFQTRTLGVTRVGLSQNTVRYFRVPTPPPDDAASIGEYLDQETAEIDAFIADQEELIGLLAERRAATISHAVSNEAQAERLPLRRLVTFLGQGWSPVCEVVPASEGQWGVLKVGCVNGGIFLPSENKALPTELEPRTQFTVRNGDILVSRGNTQELVGSAALVESDYPRLLVSDLLYQMRVNTRRVSERFLVWALSSRAVRGQIESIAKGTSPSMQKISQGDLLNLKIWLPPLAVQHEVEVRVSSETLELDAAIADAKDAIGLSRERRAALISAAVTGKIDVRERGVS